MKIQSLTTNNNIIMIIIIIMLVGSAKHPIFFLTILFFDFCIVSEGYVASNINKKFMLLLV